MARAWMCIVWVGLLDCGGGGSDGSSDGGSDASDGSHDVAPDGDAAPDMVPEEPDFAASIVIEGGAAFTAEQAVIVTLSAVGAVTVELGEESDLSDALVFEFTKTHAWDLSVGDGAKSVYARFADDAGNRSPIVSDDIVLDTTLPVLAIETPEEGAFLGTSSIEVLGTVVDATAVTVSVNGESFTVADGTFSGVVPAADGTVSLVAEGIDAAGNVGWSSARTVVVDTIAPTVTIVEPGSATSSGTVMVYGTISDATDVAVTVVGDDAVIQGIDFYAFGVVLESGENTIPIVATDAAGNVTSIALSVTRDDVAPGQPTDITVEVEGGSATVCGSAEVGATVIVAIGDVSASGTAGEDGRWCATIAVGGGDTTAFVTAEDAAENTSDTVVVTLDGEAPSAPTRLGSIVSPTSRRALIVYGFAEPGSTVRISGGAEDAEGQARSDTGFFFIGVKLKTNRPNTLSIKAIDAAGNEGSAVTVEIVQSEVAAVPNRFLTMVSGQSQRAVDGYSLALPLEVMVCDATRTPIQGVSIDFQVVGGNGSLDELAELTVESQAKGRATANWTMGPAGDVSDSLVLADFEGNEGPPVLFDATSMVAAPDDAPTTVTGSVLGNNLEPIVGASVTIVATEDASPNAGITTVTDEDGQFVITGVTEAMQQHVFVQPPGDEYPPMTQVIDIWRGQDNSLGRPIFLPNLDSESAVAVDATTGGIIQSTVVSGLSMTLDAGQVTFPDGTQSGSVIVSPVRSNRVPMPLTGGMGSEGVISVTPAWAVFDPPAAVTVPNVDGLAPGAPAQLVSFDHGLGRYVVVGTGTVSADGRVVESDPGSGIRTGAWHAFLDWLISLLTGAQGSVPNRGGGGSGRVINNESKGGDPVELVGGAFLYDHTDLEVPARHLSFEFARSYSSKLHASGPLGYGWTHNYDQRLVFEAKECTVVGPTGAWRKFSLGAPEFLLTGIPVRLGAPFHIEVLCPPSSSTDITYYDDAARAIRFRYVGGAFESPAGVHAVLESDASGFKLSRRGGLIERFDQGGRLASIEERHGDTMRFIYNGNQLTGVSDPLGRVFRFSHDLDGRITKMTDFTFRRSWQYGYDSDGNLVTVTAPDGATVRYGYLAGQAEGRLNHNLTSITNEREDKWLENTYGTVPGSYSFDKVIRQLHGNEPTTFQYMEVNAGVAPGDLTLPRNRTRMIDAQGNVFDAIHNENGHEITTRVYGNRQDFTRRLGAPNKAAVWVTQKQYDAAGMLVSMTLPRGNRLEYEYDSANTDPRVRGNLCRIEVQPGSLGTGEPIVRTFTYDPRFQQIKAMTGPRGYSSTEGPPERFTTTYTLDYEALNDATLNPNNTQFGDVVLETHPITGVDGPDDPVMTQYSYNAFGQITREVDAEGNVTRYEYFSESDPTGTGRFTRSRRNTETGGFLRRVIEDADGAALASTQTYDEFGRVTQTLLPNGATSTVEYDLLDRVTRSVDPGGTATRATYDAAGNLLRSEQDLTGDENAAELGSALVSEFEYDALSRVTVKRHQIDASRVATTALAYDTVGRFAATTSAEGLQTSREYDARGLVTTLTNTGSDGIVTKLWTYEYDVNGNRTRAVDAEGHATTFEYDVFDRQIATVTPDGTRIERVLDADSRVTETRALGLGEAGSQTLLGQTRLTYDEDGLLTRSETDRLSPLGSTLGTATVTTRYDHMGRAVALTDPYGSTTTVEYDGIGRATAIEDALSNRTEFAYGPYAQPTSIAKLWLDSDPWQQAYDILERPTVSTSPGGETTTVSYNSRGDVVSVTDALGNIRRYQYDGRGLQVRSSIELRHGGVGTGELDLSNSANPDGVIEQRRAYDLDGRLTEVRGDRTGATGYTYNTKGDLSSIVDPLGRETSVSYDDDGLLKALTDAAGTIYEYEYDSGHRRISSTVVAGPGLLPVGSQTFEYDGLGRTTYAIEPNDPEDSADDVEVSLSYDSLGNVIAGEELGRTVAATYDSAGRMETMVYPDGTTLGLSYDALSRPETVFIGGVAIHSNHYSGDELVERESGNGVTTDFTRNENRDLTAVAHRMSDTVLDGYEYNYRMQGEPSAARKLHDGNIGDTYNIDSAGRLVGVAFADGESVTYELDGDSNRTRNARDGIDTAYEIDAAGAYTAVGGVTRTYDLAGRLTSDGTRTFTYDGRGRLREVSGPSASVSYFYNVNGRVVRRSAAEGTTDITYFGLLPIEERDSLGTVNARYYAIGLDLFAADLAGERRYVHTDRLGSITSLTNSAGAIVERYSYDPFGTRTVTDAAGLPVLASLPFGFTTQRHDDEAGLVLFPARPMDPETGHFTVRDPLGAAAVSNVYAYVDHRPTAAIDPLGLNPLDSLGDIDEFMKSFEHGGQSADERYRAHREQEAFRDQVAQTTYDATIRPLEQMTEDAADVVQMTVDGDYHLRPESRFHALFAPSSEAQEISRVMMVLDYATLGIPLARGLRGVRPSTLTRIPRGPRVRASGELLKVRPRDLWLGPEMGALKEQAKRFGGVTAHSFDDLQRNATNAFWGRGMPVTQDNFYTPIGQEIVWNEISQRAIDRTVARGGNLILDISTMRNVGGLVRPGQQVGEFANTITAREFGYVLGDPDMAARTYVHSEGLLMPLQEFMSF